MKPQTAGGITITFFNPFIGFNCGGCSNIIFTFFIPRIIQTPFCPIYLFMQSSMFLRFQDDQTEMTLTSVTEKDTQRRWNPGTVPFEEQLYIEFFQLKNF
jgi:hypothetical protein